MFPSLHQHNLVFATRGNTTSGTRRFFDGDAKAALIDALEDNAPGMVMMGIMPANITTVHAWAPRQHAIDLTPLWDELRADGTIPDDALTSVATLTWADGTVDVGMPVSDSLHGVLYDTIAAAQAQGRAIFQPVAASVATKITAVRAYTWPDVAGPLADVVSWFQEGRVLAQIAVEENLDPKILRHVFSGNAHLDRPVRGWFSRYDSTGGKDPERLIDQGLVATGDALWVLRGGKTSTDAVARSAKNRPLMGFPALTPQGVARYGTALWRCHKALPRNAEKLPPLSVYLEQLHGHA